MGIGRGEKEEKHRRSQVRELRRGGRQELGAATCPQSNCGAGRMSGCGFGPRCVLPLLPIFAVRTCAGHAPPLLPGLGLSS